MLKVVTKDFCIDPDTVAYIHRTDEHHKYIVQFKNQAIHYLLLTEEEADTFKDLLKRGFE